MAFQHGKSAGVWMNEFDFSSDLTQYTFRKARQTVNVTTFGNDDKVFLSGIGEGSIAVQGVWNPAADQTDEEIVALDGAQVLISASPTAAAAVGDRVHIVRGRVDLYHPRAPHNDAVRFNATWRGDEVAYPGVVLHPNIQRSVAANFASVDGTAQSLFGATAFLHITQFSGTNATVTIEDSADDAIFGSLAAFTQATGVGSQILTPTDTGTTVERYARIALTGTFTTITFIVGFYRHRQ